MAYKDKILKKRLFAQSLSTLKEFACSEPEMPLEKRQAIIGAIHLGGSLIQNCPPHKQQTYYHLNYQYTQQGLIRACSDKLISHPHERQQVRKAICTLSSLSAWARSNPQMTEDIFFNFSNQILHKSLENDSVFEATKALKSKYGHEILLDLVTYTPNRFYKKYKQR